MKHGSAKKMLGKWFEGIRLVSAIHEAKAPITFERPISILKSILVTRFFF